MYITIGKNQFHIEQSLAMGEAEFIKAHKGSVRHIDKVWAAIKATEAPAKPKEVAKKKDK